MSADRLHSLFVFLESPVTYVSYTNTIHVSVTADVCPCVSEAMRR